MENILNIILKDTYTQTLLKHRLNVLKSYLIQSFFGNQRGTFTQIDLSWLKSLPPGLYQNFNKDNIYKIFSDLEKQIISLKTLTIYLTFEPDDLSLSQMGNFARKLFGNSLLLDVKYDPGLTAGAALVWKGVYKDYSLRAKIESRKAEILESFKKYLR